MPVWALATDLKIEASPSQVTISNVHRGPNPQATQSRHGCATGPLPDEAFGTGALVAATVLGLSGILRRRIRR